MPVTCFCVWPFVVLGMLIIKVSSVLYSLEMKIMPYAQPWLNLSMCHSFSASEIAPDAFLRGQLFMHQFIWDKNPFLLIPMPKHFAFMDKFVLQMGFCPYLDSPPSSCSLMVCRSFWWLGLLPLDWLLVEPGSSWAEAWGAGGLGGETPSK